MACATAMVSTVSSVNAQRGPKSSNCVDFVGKLSKREPMMSPAIAPITSAAASHDVVRKDLTGALFANRLGRREGFQQRRHFQPLSGELRVFGSRGCVFCGVKGEHRPIVGGGAA